MNAKRNEEIVTAGFRAAREQMDRYPARPDYPRDFDRLYDWLEDKTFNLYESIRAKKMFHVKTVAADMIVTISEIIEYADSKLQAELQEAGTDEISYH